MMYTKAILYQPAETKSHYYSKLRLELYVGDVIHAQYEGYACCFDATPDHILLYESSSRGQDYGPDKGSLRLRIPMSNISHFEKLL